ncbi:hypothetical protein AUC31_17360 [Planococcus rifietoensis]|uniref:KTSC domain-containing protein n=1 Tax=Planococcus rifietoensis TaxID=200991 RepID=A0A0U2YZ88_9BACL|nr:KTSC domain-containing protein [Planococcus rifietoensis]ALS76878.1 hypothetical protein AUC31_17360 [Planococcus rifietoensis]
MRMQAVNSSNLRAVGYDAVNSILRIEFKSGTYDYFGVPEHIYRGLMSAGSLGSYHAANIKNSFRYQRV